MVNGCSSRGVERLIARSCGPDAEGSWGSVPVVWFLKDEEELVGVMSTCLGRFVLLSRVIVTGS